MPTCAGCQQNLGRRQYSQNQLSKGESRRCKTCVSDGIVAAAEVAPPTEVAPPAESEVAEASDGSGFIFRGLHRNECPEAGTARPWLPPKFPPGLQAKAPGAQVGLERALEKGSSLPNEFIHCSASPVAAAYFTAAFSPMGTNARVVKIALSKVNAASVIDVSTMQNCRAFGLDVRSVASRYAVGHSVVLLTGPVPASAIVGIYDVSWYRDLPRGEQQSCSLQQYTDKIPKLLLSEIRGWRGPSTVKELPSWWDACFHMPLRHLWRAENPQQLSMFGPPAPCPLLETDEFEYFPARFAECIMDELDAMQRHWLIEHGVPRQTQYHVPSRDGGPGTWVQLHPNARAHVDADTQILPEWLLDPSFGALHANLAADVLASLIITRRWHDSEPRDSHVTRKCSGGSDGPEGSPAWGRQFLEGCKILEEDNTEARLLRKVKAAAVSAVRSLGFACDLDPASPDGWWPRLNYTPDQAE